MGPKIDLGLVFQFGLSFNMTIISRRPETANDVMSQPTLPLRITFSIKSPCSSGKIRNNNGRLLSIVCTYDSEEFTKVPPSIVDVVQHDCDQQRLFGCVCLFQYRPSPLLCCLSVEECLTYRRCGVSSSSGLLLCAHAYSSVFSGSCT